MDIDKYFQRIACTADKQPSLALLNTLQKQHLCNIPFENLAIHYHQPINLTTERLFEKIVINGRGGFCYELNGLFYQLLLALGFQAKLISGEVFDDKTKGYGRAYDHMAIVVTLDDINYLADVGFGEFSATPIPITHARIHHDQRGDFLIEHSEAYWGVYKKTDDLWQPEYRFDTASCQIADFRQMCEYHQTSPESHFTQKRLISLAKENGRVTITGDTLILREDDTITEQPLLHHSDFASALMTYFGIDADSLTY